MLRLNPIIIIREVIRLELSAKLINLFFVKKYLHKKSPQKKRELCRTDDTAPHYIYYICILLLDECFFGEFTKYGGIVGCDVVDSLRDKINHR